MSNLLTINRVIGKNLTRIFSLDSYATKCKKKENLSCGYNLHNILFKGIKNKIKAYVKDSEQKSLYFYLLFLECLPVLRIELIQKQNSCPLKIKCVRSPECKKDSFYE